MKNSASSKILTIICIVLAVVLCVVLAIYLFGSNDKTPDQETPTHTHSFVEGKCSCGESDPNYTPVIPDDDTPDNPVDNTVTYTVTVVDQDGAPVVGAAVQLCVGDLCKLPCPTDASGVSVFENFEPADYSVKVTVSGYTVEEYYHFDTDSTELTITVTAN